MEETYVVVGSAGIEKGFEKAEERVRGHWEGDAGKGTD